MAIEIIEMKKTINQKASHPYTLDIRTGSSEKYKFEICIAAHGESHSWSCGGYNDLERAKEFLANSVVSPHVDKLWEFCSRKGK